MFSRCFLVMIKGNKVPGMRFFSFCYVSEDLNLVLDSELFSSASPKIHQCGPKFKLDRNLSAFIPTSSGLQIMNNRIKI